MDPAHCAELPDGHTRATTVEPAPTAAVALAIEHAGDPASSVRVEARAGFAVNVAHRPLADYEILAGLEPPRPTTTERQVLIAREHVKTAQRRLGHATAAETLETYSHLWHDSDDRTREAIDGVLRSPRREGGEALRQRSDTASDV